MTAYRYFANVMAHVEFDIEAETEQEADELAKERLSKTPWQEFRDVGHELGRLKMSGYWDEVDRQGDI